MADSGSAAPGDYLTMAASLLGGEPLPDDVLCELQTDEGAGLVTRASFSIGSDSSSYGAADFTCNPGTTAWAAQLTNNSLAVTAEAFIATTRATLTP